MESVELQQLKVAKNIVTNEKAVISLLKNGEVLKRFNPLLLGVFMQCGIDLEDKVKAADEIIGIDEIIKPNKCVYANGSFVGYTMDRARGIDYNEFDDKLTMEERSDLNQYARDYLKLESIVKRGNEQGIVFPDFATCDNMFVDNGNFSLIDYDGLQVKGRKTPILSTSLGNENQFFCKKYQNGDGTFTEQLDKKSLANLFFLMAFNINLNRVGLFYNGATITLDDIFNQLGLVDADFQHKIWKTTKSTAKNEFLGEDILRIADKYNMEAYKIPKTLSGAPDDIYIKKLVRK